MFNSIKPLVRIATELRRIANALEYFATTDARTNNRMFITTRLKSSKDESELMHTDDQKITEKSIERFNQWLQGGSKLVEQIESEEDE